MNESIIKKHMINAIWDIQKNQRKIGCYPYPKTIRSILTASELSPIAPHFADKEYYGIIEGKVSLGWIIKLLEELVKEGYLVTEEHKNKKRYLRIKSAEDYYIDDEIHLTEDELSELDDLLNLLD